VGRRPTARVPSAGRPQLELVADLVIDVGDGRGSTTARLTGDEARLFLDVPDPGTLLRCVPRSGWPDGIPGAPPVTQLAGIPLRVTSRGRQLGSVSLSSSGKVRVRPALSGTSVLVRTAVGSRTGRITVVAAALVAVTAAAGICQVN